MASRDFRPALNALRALAALWVVIYHLRYYSDVDWFAVPGVSFGFLGVDFFFILSGLIISHVYAEPFFAGRSSLARFMLARIARLWPVHAFIMTAMLGFFLLRGGSLSGEAMLDWVSLTLMVRQWFMPEAYVWNHPAWSISAEMFAYLVIFPLTIIAWRRLARREAGLVLLCFAALCFSVLITRHGTLNVVAYYGPLLRVSGGFALGAGLYALIGEARLSAKWDLALAGAVAAMPIAILWDSEPGLLALLTLLIVATYLGDGPINRAMRAAPAVLAGEISYALYLVHIPALQIAREVAQRFSIPTGLSFSMSAVLASIILSWLLYRFIEVPSRRKIRGAGEAWLDRKVPALPITG